MSRLQCKYHPNSFLIEDSHAGDMVCSQCGLVVAERVIDVSSEWRTFSNDANAKDNSRVGTSENTLLTGGDISTMISGPSYSDARHFDANGKALYKNRRNIKGSDRALLLAFREISQMAERLNLPKSVSEIANRLFKQVYETKNLRGRSNDAVSTACLYMACRQEGVPRTFKEVCAVSRVSKKEIGKVFKKILKILETNVQSVTVEDFMSRFCANLNLNNQVQQFANNIARQALNLNLVSGRSPVSVAAASIYMASYILGHKREKKDIGEVTGCAEATITLTYREMHVRAADLIPQGTKLSIKLENLPL